MSTPYQSDHEQRALMIDGIMRTMFPRATKGDKTYDVAHSYAVKVTAAVCEAQDAYNVAKHEGRERVEISVSTLSVLMHCTGRLHGMDDAAGGSGRG